MRLVQKALWLIESRSRETLSLGEIAEGCCVSKFTLSRAFAAATGFSVMDYLRRRRLTESARQLAAGAPDILSVALDAGYGSHEAFTRAFRDLFLLTPEQVRAVGHLNNLGLMEPIRMDENQIVELKPPRRENSQTMLIAGISEQYTFQTNEGIPLQWQRLGPFIGNIPGQIGWTTYGVCSAADDERFHYLCGVQVSNCSDVPDELTSVRIPARQYLVFEHSGHVSTIRATVSTIWNKYLPEARIKVAQAPDFERYDDRFDPTTGAGVIEIWIPVD